MARIRSLRNQVETIDMGAEEDRATSVQDQLDDFLLRDHCHRYASNLGEEEHVMKLKM